MTVRLLRARVSGRQGDDLPRAPEGRPPGDPRSSIEPGNHNVDGDRLAPVRGWHPLEVLHFSLRSPGAARTQGGRRVAPQPRPRAARASVRCSTRLRAGETHDAYYRSLLVDDSELERGVAEGRFAIDTRLRDALRLIRDPDGSFQVPHAGSEGTLSFPVPDVAETRRLRSGGVDTRSDRRNREGGAAGRRARGQDRRPRAPA